MIFTSYLRQPRFVFNFEFLKLQLKISNLTENFLKINTKN